MRPRTSSSPPARACRRAGSCSVADQLRVEGDGDGLERLAHGASALGLLGRLLEPVGVEAADLTLDGQLDAGELEAAALLVLAEADVGGDLELVHGAAGIAEQGRELHRVAGRVGGRD